MYLFKNAFRSISRSKGRNILIGLIVLVIAVSACLGLSIRQAAETAKTDALDSLTVTAQISVDRTSMMNNMKDQTEEGGTFDKSSFADNMSSVSDLSADDLETYADADSVSSFYYTYSVSANGNDTLEPVETTQSSDEEETADDSSSADDQMMPDRPEGMENETSKEGPGGFQKGSMGTQGDFTLIGYSADDAMTAFLNGTSSLTEGTMFEENTSDANCVISDELATYNDLSVGDTITVTNPNKEEETYALTISGIYSNSESTVSTGDFMGGFAAANDPANQILMSYSALKTITDASETNADTSTDETTGTETTTAMPGQVSGTYVFASVDDYNAFETEARSLGLSDSYSITSSDVTSYEQSILPLENLSKMASYFLIVVLIIGAIILIVLNIFNIRERKYEVGVLTAIGMKKSKVAAQFLVEIFSVTLIAIVLGGGIGGAASVKVTNSLLESQISASTSSQEQKSENFGRPAGGKDNGSAPMTMKSSGGAIGTGVTNYISQVSSATDVTVLLQLLGIGILLTLFAGSASIIFIMRYDPLKILSNRD